MVSVVLNGLLANYSSIPSSMQLFIDDHDTLIEVEGIYFSLHAIKTTNDASPDVKEERVALHQAGASRTKKEAKTVEPVPFSAGRASLSKLQFGSATANNARLPNGSTNPHQQYFKVIVCLQAKAKDSKNWFTIAAKQSMKIIVRGQNPGRYNGVSMQANAGNSPWLSNADNIFHFGNVGINTENPPEALSVTGNLLVTGEVIRPSDKRMKANFHQVSTAEQLENIERLKIYDYDIVDMAAGKDAPKFKRERGVIAQEVAMDLPEAVRVIGDLQITNDKTVKNCLVVSDRVLLYENIGATQELDHAIKKQKQDMQIVQERVSQISSEAKQEAAAVAVHVREVVSYLSSQQDIDADIGGITRQPQTQVSIDVRPTGSVSAREPLLSPAPPVPWWQFSMLDLGPAWSMFVLGFFLPLLWLAGFAYFFSSALTRRIAGAASIIMLLVRITHLVFAVEHFTLLSMWVGNAIFFGFGLVCCGLMLLGKRLASGKKIRDRQKLTGALVTERTQLAGKARLLPNSPRILRYNSINS